MANENNNNAVATMTEENKVTQKLLMDYLKQTNSNLLQNEMAQFVAIATTFNLNPWKREVYAIAYGQGNGRKLSIIVGYEVYLRRAEEFPQYDGYETKFNGTGADMSCTCIVYRKDRNHPIGATVFLREYTQNNQMWNNKPHVMLEKVAIATALRRAFPSVFNGMPYIADELPDKMTGGDRMREQGFVEVHGEMPEQPQNTWVKDPKSENHAEVPHAEETDAQRTETAQNAVEAEDVDSDTRNFLNAMKKLARQNRQAYMDAMGKLGFESAGDVPPERRQAIYTAVNNAVVGATKEG